MASPAEMYVERKTTNNREWCVPFTLFQKKRALCCVENSFFASRERTRTKQTWVNAHAICMLLDQRRLSAATRFLRNSNTLVRDQILFLQMSNLLSFPPSVCSASTNIHEQFLTGFKGEERQHAVSVLGTSFSLFFHCCLGGPHRSPSLQRFLLSCAISFICVLPFFLSLSLLVAPRCLSSVRLLRSRLSLPLCLSSVSSLSSPSLYLFSRRSGSLRREEAVKLLFAAPQHTLATPASWNRRTWTLRVAERLNVR